MRIICLCVFWFFLLFLTLSSVRKHNYKVNIWLLTLIIDRKEYTWNFWWKHWLKIFRKMAGKTKVNYGKGKFTELLIMLIQMWNDHELLLLPLQCTCQTWNHEVYMWRFFFLSFVCCAGLWAKNTCWTKKSNTVNYNGSYALRWVKLFFCHWALRK